MGNYSAKKIVIVGVSASGKSTFARKIGKILDLPVTHMDAIMWQPGWQYVGDEVVNQKINDISDTPTWIIEGYITSSARIDLFTKADQILYLDYPGWLSALRYIKRWWLHRKNPRPELPGSPEKFSLKFLKLVYTKGEVYNLEKLVKEHELNHKIIRLTSPQSTEQYLCTL